MNYELRVMDDELLREVPRFSSFIIRNQSLFPYYHFGVAQHFVVQCIPRLHTIQNLTFLCFRRCGDYRDGFMEISIQRLVFRLDDFHTNFEPEQP